MLYFEGGQIKWHTTKRACGRWGNRIPSARNRCRFEIQKMKVKTKSQIEKLLPELKPIKEPNAHCYFFRPTIGNTHVGRSAYWLVS